MRHLEKKGKSLAASGITMDMLDAIKTISLPQMVSSERTMPGIQKVIDENLEKRLDHYMDRYMGS